MKARFEGVATLLIALHCAIWMAFAPIVPHLHQSFARHSHVYSSEHQRFEDAGPRQAGTVWGFGAGERSGLKNGSTGKPCDFSNLAVQVAQSSPVPNTAPVPLEDRDPEPAIAARASTLDLLRLAPKHSPPSPV